MIPESSGPSDPVQELCLTKLVQELSAVARFVLGLAFLFGGQYRSAVAELTVDAEAYVRSLRIAAVGSSGTLAVDGLAVLGDALGQLGRWDDAMRQGMAAQAVARETGIAWDMHVANYHLARTFLARGDPETALPMITWNMTLRNAAVFRWF